MNVLLLFFGATGFACLPPNDALLKVPLDTPYTGPFLMPVNEALKYQTEWNAKHRGFESLLEIVYEGDPNFYNILERCPPIY